MSIIYFTVTSFYVCIDCCYLAASRDETAAVIMLIACRVRLGHCAMNVNGVQSLDGSRSAVEPRQEESCILELLINP
jgi:hypothetical protein